MIKVDFTNALSESVFSKYLGRVKDIHQMINNKTRLGNDFLGWVELPNNYDQAELAKMKQTAKKLASEIDVLLVIGIGGSYLGARSAIEMINGLYSQQKVEIIYIGNTMSSTYTAQVLEYLQDKKFGICVVSKSGTTTEPAIAFRLCKELLEKKEGSTKAANLIVAITDKEKGALKILANEAGYQTFVIPDDIGGRYSVLTPVGIFAFLVSGINVDNVFKGAQQAYQDTLIDDFTNHAYKYAVGRYILNQEKKYKAEMLVTYELQMQMIAEWWKQLFGESEGKNSKGLLPLSCVFSTDLHSLGQFIQEGTKNILFETVIAIKEPQIDLNLPKATVDTDSLNYFAGRTLHEVNTIAVESVVAAHTKVGHVPNIVLEFATMDDKMFGYLSYWFMKACAMSAYLLEINPFDQPGVEIYKQNMFNLLRKQKTK